jgi:hypothetical protein
VVDVRVDVGRVVVAERRAGWARLKHVAVFDIPENEIKKL